MPGARQWEYWFLDDPTIEQLNEMGAYGWDLTAAATYASPARSITNEVMEYVWHERVYFKRPAASE